MVSYEYFIYNVKLFQPDMKKLPHPMGTAVIKLYFTIA